MNGVLNVTRKELSSLFRSPMALIFLAIFLGATHYAFFTHEQFFSQNIANTRPLFAWLPLLLIFLVAAITMGQWAEEKKLGTVEVLLTLPVRTVDLVLGKFIAGLALVVVALALTFPIPLSVSQLGALDWGPVIGGYIGAVALSSMYLAIGLCVSARNDNQTAALMFTLLIGGILYVIGTPTVTNAFSMETAEIFTALGSGSRFAAVERGVLDLRDMFYYGSLSVFFLTLNAFFLEVQKVDWASKTGQRRLTAWLLTLLLTAGNVIAGNLWLAPVTATRWDMTANQEYSVSDVTVDMLAGLEEPLQITGYFSDRTHPLLAPLVPEIRDLLAEYEIYGRGRVDIDFQNPNSDEELEDEINEAYGIKSFPFQVSDKHQKAVVNSYFHILIKYGDKFEVLSFDQLIDVHQGKEIDVALRNLEYDLTRTIKRVTQDFQSLETILAKLPEGATLTAYITPETLPDDVGDLPERIRSVGAEVAKASGGRLTFLEEDPSKDQILAQSLYEKYGVQPMSADLFGRQRFYLHLVLVAGDKVERLRPSGDVTEADLKRAVEAAVKRAVPGQLKTVGIFTEIPEPPPPNPQIPPQYQPPPPQPDYRGIQQTIASDYQVEVVDLSSGSVAEHIDVLVVGKPGAMSDVQAFAIDQYLMRGGKLIALAGRYRIDQSRQGQLGVQEEDGRFAELLSTWGINVQNALVLDAANAPFPIPMRDRRRVELVPYPFFPDVRREQLAQDHVATAGINNLTVPWASPLEIAAPEGVETKVLVSSSADSWLSETGNIAPDFKAFPDAGFAKGTQTSSKVLAAVASGKFPSYFADKPNPIFGPQAGEALDGGELDTTGRTLTEALPGARLAVIGSSEMMGDLILQMSMTPQHRNNIDFLKNLTDWSVEDTALLEIRSSGGFARTLVPMTEDERTFWEFTNYALAVFLFGGVLALVVLRRFSVRPLARTGGAR
jgi:ABC-2 type transport system permease protein